MAAIVTLTMNPALDIATATERIVPTHKLRCDMPRYDPGGGGINVARAVHALGGDALAIFPAGGSAGDMVRHLLAAEGVAHAAVAVAGFTRESLAVEERASSEQYRFILPGPEIGPADQQRCLDRLAAAAADAAYIVASGSLPPGAPEDFYARVAALAGDSMLAGILVGLTRGLSLPDSVQLGMAAGTAALFGRGTQSCHLADVERLYAAARSAASPR